VIFGAYVKPDPEALSVSDTAARELPVCNPRTGQPDYRMSLASAEEISAVAARLRANQVAWSAAGPAHRAEVIKAWSARLLAAPGPLLNALSTDTGRHLGIGRSKPLLSAVIAVRRDADEQHSQLSMSMWNTRFSRCAQLMARCRSAGLRSLTPVSCSA
jgi:acyl-CoA reductase-like NAD-dependent aldehyde dehydrogenase